ncbi:hypothetical protein QYS48_22215 [Marivirga arenosa]|uniref:Uncharacterized protein n=1 Tax=Marivirga arenosa TaxID=3059076 RepID=A0AA49GG98_9BACT|nr:hypothetical protein [Marivirga sp. ABR2-2]WKK84798.1 hypothetical protein QYS48_22215 [Marivirga sp. ABR2-2]
MSLFTTQELDLASDPTILLIKYRMMEKVWDYLEEIHKEFRTHLKKISTHIPKEINLNHGKISKGENYKRLPYSILDYPAYFSKEDIFAYRTMFYWGNFFSSTFHLQGDYLNKFGDLFIDHFKSDESTYFCINRKPWDYHYEKSNYVKFHTLSLTEISDHIDETGFIKISKKFPVEEMPERKEDVLSFLLEGLELFKTN